MTSQAPGGVLQRRGAVVLHILAVAALYYGGARLGLLEQLMRGQVTPMWPPTGIALTSLLLLGLRCWPGIALGAFLVNIGLGPSLAAVAVITLGNTLAPVFSYLLLRRARFRKELDRFRDALLLVFFGAFAGMVISATAGAGTLALAGVLPVGGFWPTWSVWWTGDAMGILVVAPVLLALSSARRREVSPARWAEASILLLGVFLVSLVATGTPSRLFLVFPFLIWAAFRFQLPGAAACALVVSTFAILAATEGAGPFAGQDVLTNMITLQAFDGSVALTALLLSAAVSERNRIHEEIVRVCDQLSRVVAGMEPDDGR